MPGREPGKWSRRFRALTTDVEVVADDEHIAGLLESWTRSLAPAHHQPTLRYSLLASPPRLCRDGHRVFASDHRLDLVPRFEFDLYREMIWRAADHWVVHGAALAIDNHTVVLVGESGDGKSTAAATLVESGASYLADEHVAIDRAGMVIGLPRPLAIGDQVARALTCLRPIEYPLRDAAKQTIKQTVYRVIDRQLDHDPVALGAVVRIRYRPDRPPSLRRIGAGETLASCWDCTFNPGEQVLVQATELVSRTPLFAAESATPDDLLAAVERVTRSSGWPAGE